jgi:SET domain
MSACAMRTHAYHQHLRHFHWCVRTTHCAARACFAHLGNHHARLPQLPAACAHCCQQVAPTWSWPEADLALLEGSPVLRATASMTKKLEAEYELARTTLLERHPARLPASVHTAEAFRWALAMLFSRAIRLASLASGEAIALVPYADLINHNPFANAYVDAREAGWLKKVDEVAVYSDRSYKKMEQASTTPQWLLCKYVRMFAGAMCVLTAEIATCKSSCAW